MSIASSARARLKFAKESTYGVAPSAATFKLLRRLGASLSVRPVTIQSGEVRSDRQRVQSVVIGKTVSGDTSHELMPRGYDDLIAGALFNTITKTPELAVTAVGAGTGVYTVPSAGATIPVNGLVEVDGCAAPINNSYRADGTLKAFLVTASAATSVTTDNSASTSASSQTGTLKLVGTQAATGDLAIGTSGGQITLTLTAGSWPTGYLQPGQWIYLGSFVAGYGLTGLNAAKHTGWYRLSAVSTKVLTCDIKPPTADGTSVSSAANPVRVYFGDFVANGTTFQSYTVERSFMDIGVHEMFTGCAVNGMTIEMSEKSIVRCGFSFVGKDGTASNTEYATAPIAATVNAPFTTAANIGLLAVGGVGIVQTDQTDAVRAVSIQLSNGIQEMPALATASGIVGVIAGSCDVSGRFTTYFADLSLYNQLFNNVTSQFSTAMLNARGGAAVVDVPYISFSDGQPQIGDAGTAPVTLDLSYTAAVHPTLGYTIGFSLLSLVGF